jgi:O-antigen ligase
MSNVAYVCLWFLTFAIPWEASLLVPGIGTIGRLVGLVTAPIGVLAILARGRARPLAALHILAGCFVIWVGLTSAWSMDMERTRLSFQSVVQVAALPWLIWELAATPQRRKGLLQAYVFGAYVSVINILLNYHSGFASSGQGELTTRDTGRYSAEGFNPNDLGFLLVLAIPLAWHLSLTHRNVILRWVNRLYIPFGMVAILLTGSRSSLIGAVLALCIVPLTLGRLSLGMKFGVITIAIATLLGGALFVPEKTLARLSTTKEEIESGTLNERRVIWKAGFEAYLRHPVLGVGAGAFPTAVKPFLGVKKTAHNTYLSVLVEEGTVGILLFSLMLLSIFFHVRASPPEERRLAFLMLFTIVIGLLPRAWEFDKPLWLMFGLLLAPSSAAAAFVRQRRPWAPVQVPLQPRSRLAGREPAPYPRGSVK